MLGTYDEGEKFWNFDQTGAEASAGMDHGVSILFYNNAEVNKVKNNMGTFLSRSNVSKAL